MTKQHFRTFFRWEVSQWFIAIFFGAGLTLALEKQFVLAYVCFVTLGVWLILFWLFSDFLAHRLAVLNERRIRKDPALLRTQRRNYRIWKWSVSGLLVGIAIACIALVHLAQAKHELESLEGWLLPANNPDPPNEACSGQFVPQRALKIYLGKFEAFGSAFPYAVLAVNKQKAIILDRDQNGRIAVDLEIRDSDGKIVVMFQKGHFTINPNNYLKMERPDRSTLIVYDQRNTEVLNAYYLNKTHLELGALLRYSGANPVRIPKSTFADVCVGDVGSIGINVEAH